MTRRPQAPLRRALRPLAAILLGSLLAAGCASYTDETREIRSLYRADNYHAALDKLDKSDIKDQSKNRLLYRLEKAMILDRMGEPDKSRALLIEADKIADQLYTVSISKTAESFIVNDAATDYSGEDYEKVAIHTELALSYLGQKDLANARVEARKINNKLQEINQKYDQHKDRYDEDAFARYLSGIIYEARGEVDDAIIDEWKAVQDYAGDFSQFTTGGVPDDLVRGLYRLCAQRGRTDKMRQLEQKYPKAVAEAKADLASPNAGEVIVVHEIGHIAVKKAQDFIFPFGKQVIRFSYPVIPDTHHPIYGRTGITDESTGRYHAGDNTEDMDAIAHWTLEDKRARMLLKESARLIAKGQLTEQAYRQFGLLGGIAANVYSAVSETADTRSWTLLPEAFYITRMRLPAGKHTLKIESGGRVGKLETIDVKKGQIEILRDVG